LHERFVDLTPLYQLHGLFSVELYEGIMFGETERVGMETAMTFAVLSQHSRGETEEKQQQKPVSRQRFE